MTAHEPKGPDVDRYRRAERGRERNYRAPSVFMRAALWLDGRGYHDAAEALARGARGELKQFWSERRLQAFTIALRSDNAPDWSGEEPLATGAVITNAASFLRAAGLMLLLDSEKKIKPSDASRIRKAVALLAVAVLDATDENWRSRRW